LKTYQGQSYKPSKNNNFVLLGGDKAAFQRQVRAALVHNVTTSFGIAENSEKSLQSLNSS
jgi:hypothetical protein